MGNLLTVTQYNPIDDALKAGAVEEQLIRIKANEGALLRGQVMAFDESTGTWVKYATSGGDASTNIARAILSKAITVGATIGVEKAIVTGTVLATGLIGIDYIVPTTEMATPATPTGVVQAGGTLAATTAHKYKVVAVDESGGITTPSGILTVNTLAVAAGYITGRVVANIAAVNGVLGDCSVVNKSVTFTVDGTTYTKVFNLDYSGAGALGAHSNLITALDTAASTVTSSDGAAIKIASDTTGAASIVTIVADTTGLFTTPTTVAGVAVSRTIKVTVGAVAGAVNYNVYRSVDGGTDYYKRAMTTAEITQGYITDDGSLTWTPLTVPATVTDWAAINDLFDRKIFIKEVTEGYNFRGGY